MASVEERMFQLGADELAEQERAVAQLRSRPPAMLAAGAVVPSLLARAVFTGPHPRGVEIVSRCSGSSAGSCCWSPRC